MKHNLQHVTTGHLVHVLVKLTTLAEDDRDDNAQVEAEDSIARLEREEALEVEALMYFGRGDFDSMDQARRSMFRDGFHAEGAASQIVSKGKRALEYVSNGIERLDPDLVIADHPWTN